MSHALPSVIAGHPTNFDGTRYAPSPGDYLPERAVRRRFAFFQISTGTAQIYLTGTSAACLL